jgi:glycerophosphoryl diester phosphodiesterase
MDVELIAHRGSSFLAPENTLAAAHLAWQEGADAVEGDFRLTKDGRLVCVHDDSLKRTAGIDRRVADCTLDELRTYDVGRWKGEQFSGQRIKTLDELLATVPARKRFFVELKYHRPDDLMELKRVVEASSLEPQQIIIICLHIGAIALIKHAIPQCPAFWVVAAEQNSPAENDRRWPHVDDLRSMAKDLKLDGLDLQAIWPIDTAAVRQLQQAGLELCVWTVDDPLIARGWIDLGIHSITTNRPGWLRNQLGLSSSHSG